MIAEGSTCSPGCNKALHLHPLLNDIDVYNQGKPTRIANLPDGVDIRQGIGSLPVAEGIQNRVFSIPWFKKYRPEIIEEHAAAFKKVAENYKELLASQANAVLKIVEDLTSLIVSTNERVVKLTKELA